MNIETCEALRIDERGAIEWTQLIELSGLPLPTLQRFSPLISEDVYDALSLHGSLRARNTAG